MADNRAYVFISYARQDLPVAQRLYAALKAVGANPWLDVESLRPGERWRTAINRAIRDSRYFIAVLSTHAVSTNGFVHSELRQALTVLDEYPDNDIFLIPVRVDDCAPAQDRLKDLNWVDLFPSFEDGFRRIRDVVTQGEASEKNDDLTDIALGFYLYVSDSKLEMLASQLPTKRLQKLSAELGIDSELVAGSIDHEQVKNNRYAVASIVTRHLEQSGEIGSCDAPRSYFTGELSMQWGPYNPDWDKPSPLVYFGGHTHDTIVGLGGSAHHVIGATGQARAHSQSATPYLVATLYRALDMSFPKVDEASLRAAEQYFGKARENHNIAMAVDLATSQMNGPAEPVSFVAKRLAFFEKGKHDAWQTDKNIILGTPLWVRLTDK